MKAFVVYSTYLHQDEETLVQLFGRLENGQSFVSQNKIEPYFFIQQKDLKKAQKYLAKFKVEKSNFTNFKGVPVIKLSSKTQTELNKLYEALHKTIETYEADIKPHMRFLMDLNIKGAVEIDGSYQSSEKIDRVYHEPNLSPLKEPYFPKLKILSVDTESGEKGELFCISLFSEKIKKVFMITPHKLTNVINCSDEYDCLNKVRSEILKIDPDIITGWSFINHDLKLLEELFQKNKLAFDIGRTNEAPRIRIESSFFRNSTAKLAGRQVIDSLSLLRDPFIKEAPSIKFADFESYTLEDVSQSLLKKGKLIKGKDRHEEIISLYKSNSPAKHQKLADYNLLDAQLVYEILEKTKIIELATERSQLTGLPLDRLTGSIAAFDSLYIREAHAKNLVSPTLKFSQKEERIKGGYVSPSQPGIYQNVLVLDFKSLYPSIIKTFNIDPASQLPSKQKDAIESPNKAYFKNTDGILPAIIEKLHQAREKAKKEKRELSSYAIKIIMNSFFGVLASPNCRYFNLDMANAITHFGQFIIKLTAKQIEAEGHKVIYSDTDSVFLETKLSSKEKSLALGEKIQENINEFYKDYVKKNYSRNSFLELEFKKLYLSFMMPKIRGSEAGAKKRYAGLVEEEGKEKVEIVGLEAIRGDWTEAAQEFQVSLLEKVFHNEPVEEFILSYISKLKSGKLDEKLVYKKSIRKNLSAYTKTTPPHVKAARQLKTLDSNIIQYYITTNGPEPIQKRRHKIDYKHYIDKQLKPIAQQVLVLFNKDFDDVVKGSKQATLF